jgi:hypothetical protein
MGIYINPPGVDTKSGKISYIALHAEKTDQDGFRSWPPGKNGKFGVCVVDNGPFNAAGVAMDKREAEAFTMQRDARQKLFFLMPLEAMKGCLPIKDEAELTQIAAKATV